MALACLVGGEGHYGQPRANVSSSVLQSDDSAMLIMPDEAKQLVELLANALHQRCKNGPGGYSINTFSAKCVLQAVRCLLVTISNQKTFMSSCGIKLNGLLLKALARHSIQRDQTIDAEAAECACFSLYLLSNLGFKRPFLPQNYEEDGLAEKVLTSYLHVENTTHAGRHAADQLLLRLPNLIFNGYVSDHESTVASDYEFEAALLNEAQNIIVQNRAIGTKPMDEIFDRPILRSRTPKKGEPEGPRQKAGRVSEFPSGK